MVNLQTKAEQRLISDYYEELVKACEHKVSEEGMQRIHKAFDARLCA